MATTLPHGTEQTVERARNRHTRREALPQLGFLFIIAIVIGLVLLQMVPPAVVNRFAEAGVFSAERALDHLQVIARAPHPTGTAESFLVRDYLVEQLQLLGLDAEVQTGNSVYHDTGKWGIPGPKGMEVGEDTWALAGATVHNVMARIPGTSSSGAVVLAAHYDSVPYGPGASDDGAGVAAILEAARALLAGPQLRNDIILLLTDGEEIGLMGAQAFVSHHPWMEDVALVLNLEARGSGGTVLMYETNLDSAWIIHEYAKAAVAPLTSSVATDVWRKMPNSSDLTLFLGNNKQGMNFAYGENWTAYHTTQDSIEDLDPRSLQHHGENVLSLAKHFGEIDLKNRTSGDAIFFSVLRLGIIQYPKSWALPLMIGVIVGYLLVLGLGFRLKRLTAKGFGWGMTAFLIAAVLSALAGFISVKALEVAKNGALAVGMGGTYDVHGYELGLLAIYLSITGVTYALFQRKAKPAELAAGGLFYWVILTVVTTLLLPGASYMFFWPLVAGIIVLGISLFAVNLRHVLRGMVQVFPVVVGLVLVGTVVYLVQLMFGIGILPAGGFLTTLTLALAFPYLEFRQLPRPKAWATTSAILGFVFIVLTALLSSTQADQPVLNFTYYSLNADTGRASWVAQAHMPDETLDPLFGHAPHQGHLSEYFPTTDDTSVWVEDAPAVDEPAPVLRIIEDSTNGSERFLRLNLSSPRSANGIMAEVVAQDAILTASLYGEQHDRENPRSTVFFKVIGLTEDGVEIALTVRPGVPLTIRLADVRYGLPLDADQAAAFGSALRSGYGGGHGIDSTTLIHRTYQLP